MRARSLLGSPSYQFHLPAILYRIKKKFQKWAIIFVQVLFDENIFWVRGLGKYFSPSPYFLPIVDFETENWGRNFFSGGSGSTLSKLLSVAILYILKLSICCFWLILQIFNLLPLSGGKQSHMFVRSATFIWQKCSAAGTTHALLSQIQNTKTKMQPRWHHPYSNTKPPSSV